MHLLHLSSHVQNGAEAVGNADQVGGQSQGYETLESPNLMQQSQGHLPGHDSQLAPQNALVHRKYFWKLSFIIHTVGVPIICLSFLVHILFYRQCNLPRCLRISCGIIKMITIRYVVYLFKFSSIIRIENTDYHLANPNAFVPAFNNSADGQIVDPTTLPFSDFLSNVMTLQPYDPNRLDESQGLSVLNFCDDTNLELNEMDFGLLGYYNNGEMMNDYYPDGMTNQMPRPEDSVDMSEMRQKLAQIWTKSPWRWIPDTLDHAYSEQHNLPVPSKDVNSSEFQASRQRVDRVIPDRLEAITRDKLLATVLSTCQEASTMRRIASSFPSVEVLDTLIHIFMASHLCLSSPWLHISSLKLNAQFPEWIAATLAAGAVLTPVPTLRKFGFALQEAVRLAVVSRVSNFTKTCGI